MAKPSRRKAAARRAPRPAPTVETQSEEIAKFDHDGDGHIGGSLPRNAEAAETDARSQSVMLGPVECRMRRVPVGTVLGLLSPEGLRRIEAEKETGSFEATRQRLLATDGRATPVIFEAPALAAGQATILHGYAELAAAEDCGVNGVDVILVPAGGASEAQAHIVEMVRQQRNSERPPEDDELIWRHSAHDE